MGMKSMNPIWAGVIVQLDDGTTWAVEIDRFFDIRFSLEREPDEEDEYTSFGSDHRHYMPSPDLKVEVHIRGLGRQATRWNPPTPPSRPEIEPERKAIER